VSLNLFNLKSFILIEVDEFLAAKCNQDDQHKDSEHLQYFDPAFESVFEVTQTALLDQVLGWVVADILVRLGTR
jgi:hypothetical protein